MEVDGAVFVRREPEVRLAPGVVVTGDAAGGHLHRAAVETVRTDVGDPGGADVLAEIPGGDQPGHRQRVAATREGPDLVT